MRIERRRKDCDFQTYLLWVRSWINKMQSRSKSFLWKRSLFKCNVNVWMVLLCIMYFRCKLNLSKNSMPACLTTFHLVVYFYRFVCPNDWALSVTCVSRVCLFFVKNKQTNKQKKNKQGSIFSYRLSKPQW